MLSEVQPGRGYVEGIAAVSTLTGPMARLEAGWRPRSNLGLFGYGQWTPDESSAGLGARLTF